MDEEARSQTPSEMAANPPLLLLLLGLCLCKWLGRECGLVAPILPTVQHASLLCISSVSCPFPGHSRGTNVMARCMLSPSAGTILIRAHSDLDKVGTSSRFCQWEHCSSEKLQVSPSYKAGSRRAVFEVGSSGPKSMPFPSTAQPPLHSHPSQDGTAPLAPPGSLE